MNYIDDWLILAPSHQLAVCHRDVVLAHMKECAFSTTEDTFLVVMLTCLGNVEETLVPVLGSSVGSFMSSQDANDRCLSYGLGSDLRGMLKSGSVEGPSSLMAHQPSGDVGCISCSQEFPSRSQGPPCARPLRQHIGGLQHKSTGGFAVTSTLQTGVPNSPVVPWEVVVSSSSLHPRGPQYRSRHPVEIGPEAQGIEAPPRGGGADMEGVQPGTSGSVCISRNVSLSTLVHPHASSSSRTGRDGADLAEASSVCISPKYSAPGSPGESSPGPGSTTSHCSTVAGQSMVPRYNIPSQRASSAAPRQEGPSVPSSIFHPQPELWKLWAWPLRGPAHRLRSLNRGC